MLWATYRTTFEIFQNKTASLSFTICIGKQLLSGAEQFNDHFSGKRGENYRETQLVNPGVRTEGIINIFFVLSVLQNMDLRSYEFWILLEEMGQ